MIDEKVNSEFNNSEEFQHQNNLKSADHERSLIKHDVQDTDTDRDKSEKKKILFDDDQKKFDISELITVVHPLSDEYKGVLNEKQRNAIQKGDYVRVAGGWHHSWPRKNVLVFPEVWWLEVAEVRQDHLKVQIDKPACLFGPDFEPQFWLNRLLCLELLIFAQSIIIYAISTYY